MVNTIKERDLTFNHYISSLPKQLCRSQEQVLWAVFTTSRLLSAQEIYRWLKDSEGEQAPGLTTVYRAVDSLCNQGYLQCVLLSDGERRYELLAPGYHHHHLRCNRCKRSVRLDDCLIAASRESIEKRFDFLITSHTVEVTGLCHECRGSTDRREREGCDVHA